jgi:hypothetical protein
MSAPDQDQEQFNWYIQHGCEHAHCPYGCEKPQPFELKGVLYCSRCSAERGIRVEMVPCTPETCPEDEGDAGT